MMNDHFDRMLATDDHHLSTSGRDGSQQYIRAEKFQGRKEGYIFQMGPHGLGYYFDKYQKPTPSSTTKSSTDSSMSENKKRKLNELTSSSSMSVEKLLEESEQNDVEILNPVTLTKLLLSFERKINKNQSLRMKHADQPESFLDSEIELHKEINNLYAISASPELYPVVVESGSVPSILGMIAHDNTDISIAAIGLILELTDPDTILESDDAEILIDSFLDHQALELIVQNLIRLDENQDADAQGVHDSLEIIENLVEIRPTLAETICEKTHILRYLLNRLIGKSFDDNKLYCSEILSILLQTGSSNLKRLHNIAPESSEQIDGIDLLLQAIFPYRKKDPKIAEEKEFLQNIFLCLCTALMDPENQIRFREREGFELMEKCFKENKIAAGSAVRVISYAILNNRENCLQLLQVNGLKYLFPFFMGRGIPSGIDKVGKREIEESVISIISQLCLQLHNVTEASASSRLLSKLIENQLEKTERCVELFAKYSKLLALTESELDSFIRTLTTRVAKGDQEAELELQLLDTDEARYLKRLDGGLHTLQQLAIIITFVCVSMNQDQGVIRRLHSKLADIVQISFFEIQIILRELAASIEINEGNNDNEEGGDGTGEADPSSSSSQQSFDRIEQERRKEQRKMLIEWSACLAVIESELSE